MADTKRSAASDAEDLDIIRLSSEATPDPKREERRPLFFIDDTAYTVPKYPDPAIGLRYLQKAHEEGSDEANYFLLKTLLGDEGYEALIDYSDQGLLSPDDYDAVIALALKIISRQSDPKTKRPNRRPGGGSRRR